MIWELVAAALGGGVFGSAMTISLASRAQPGFRDMDEAEDFVNLLDDASFKRLFSATLLRDKRRGHPSGRA